jgi:hypothetical protein
VRRRRRVGPRGPRRTCVRGAPRYRTRGQQPASVPRLQSEPDELGKGDDPVLPLRKLGDRPLEPFDASGGDGGGIPVTVQHQRVTTQRRPRYG